ncbi:glyoxylase-like metal-dependent hydrolase (beta-lactamase superfamily II) [Ochrobactrum sp. J50]|uniref:MBL fold metallo-hydrolase n=1 Tax=Brucella/Ochrobactrum group TaxID=2826938 RepID=UPI0011A0B3FC|nr:MBL fold metallo-hydrolase [Ochrobactrum sp. J50]TWH02307.1 glyoxylase-like metal-dependent hydrolase (beta-lactamase superfamily II) [Ochrobactrum sp. J50]WPM80643.1 MBL fold metallo-hydrolase [Brucella pseudintermedia]
MALVFDSSFTPQYGEPVELGKGILRLTVNNPSAFTFHGTNSYIIGTDTLAVIDPGPDNDAHYNALIAAIAGRSVSHIFVSHTHRDHSPLAQRLKESLCARTVAEGAHRPARPYYAGEVNMLEASADTDFIPDIALADGGTIEGDGWAVEGIHTPGHAANHMAFGLKNTGVLFSADHVMAWATSIVAPPDGSMSDYMVSLEKLLARDDEVYLPGHGGAVTKPAAFVRGLRAHRKMRERAIFERVLQGDRTIGDMVKAIYRDTDPRLYGAAALSVLAHLEDLVGRGEVKTDDHPSLDSIYIRG